MSTHAHSAAGRTLKERLQVKAEAIGFDLFGVADARPSQQLESYRTWLKAGMHGQMHYLEQHLPLKENPALLLPELRSIVVVACSYYAPEPLAQSDFQVARYAWGDDYHVLMKQMLEQLAAALKTEAPELEYRVFVDSGPLLERDLASRAGLGWIGKNTCLIHPQKGSWFLLGCLLSNLDLPPDRPFDSFHCGSCTRCLDACPTEALVAPHVLDARKCISYWTIEQREAIAPEMQEAIGNWLFGCDICQQVCPWNQRFALPTQLEAFYPRAWLQQASLPELLDLSEKDFALKIAPRSPIKRAKYRGFLRNLAVVMGNSGRPDYRPALQAAKVQHAEDAMLQSHFDWALQRLDAAASAQGLRV